MSEFGNGTVVNADAPAGFRHRFNRLFLAFWDLKVCQTCGSLVSANLAAKHSERCGQTYKRLDEELKEFYK